MPYSGKYHLYQERLCSHRKAHDVHTWSEIEKVECDGLNLFGKEGHEPHEYTRERAYVCVGRYE